MHRLCGQIARYTISYASCTNPQDITGEYLLYNLSLAYSAEFTPMLDSISDELSGSTVHKSICYLESFLYSYFIVH